MKIPPNVVELFNQGFNNREIAEQTGMHRMTIGHYRHRLGIPNVHRGRRPATNIERLYAEAVPTGRVKDYAPPTGRLPLSPAQQAANRAALLAGLREAA